MAERHAFSHEIFAFIYIYIYIDCTKLAIAIFPRSYKLQFRSYKDLKKDAMRYVILMK